MAYITFALFMMMQYAVLHLTLAYSMNYGKLSTKN